MKEIWRQIESGELLEAEQSCQQTIAKGLATAEPHFALAVIALHRGDPETAIKYSHQAIEIDPRNLSILNLIADCWRRLGRPFEALQAFDAMVQLGSQNASGYFGLADVFAAAGATFDAAEALAVGARLDPSPAVWVRLAEFEVSLGRPQMALKAAQRALDLDACNLSAHLIAGRSMTELGELDRAEAHWRSAKREQAIAWRVEGQKGFALSLIGRFAESEACLKESLKLNPSQGAAYELIFAGRKAHADDRELLAKMEWLSENAKLGLEELAPLQFALGKAWDDLGDPARAMEWFESANRTRRGERGVERPFHRDQELRRWGWFRRVFSNSFPVPHGPARDKPIFVVGIMRSGTTLLEQILASHPQVCGAGELDFWRGSELVLRDTECDGLRRELLPERRAAYLRLLSSVGGDHPRVVDKYHANLIASGLIHEAFPDAPIIHIHRCPLDTALSMWKTDSSAAYLWERKNIIFAIRQAQEQAAYWRSILPANRFMDLSYEDLVTHPERSIRAVLEFCGLPWHEGCLTGHKSQRSIRTISVWQARQPIYKESVDRWKRYEPWLGEFRELLEMDSFSHDPPT